jgi:hypothetical protein
MIFHSPNKWFSISLPGHWAEYDSEDDGTYAFFNTEKWSGNLRITPLRNSGEKKDMVTVLLSSALENNSTAQRIALGGMEAVKSVENDDEENLTIYRWDVGKDEMAFLCSFTTDHEHAGLSEFITELETVERIIASIKITGNHT